MFNEVKDAGAYWNLIKKATNQNIKNKIGPFKRDDGTLALINEDKADLLNFYFSRIGENLASALPDPEISQVYDQGSVCVREIPTISEVNLMQHNVRREINELKTNKSTGPDNISPKLLRLAGNDIASSLTKLYHVSLNNGVVFSSWKIARLTPIFKKDEESDVELKTTDQF